MSETRLIHSKSGAMFGVVVTGFVAYQTMRGIQHHRAVHSEWILLSFPSLPHWFLVALNVFFYANIVWLCAIFLSIGRKKEGVILAGWAAALLLGLIQPFVSPEVAISIQYTKGLAMGAAFMMAVSYRDHILRARKNRAEWRSFASSEVVLVLCPIRVIRVNPWLRLVFSSLTT